MPRVGEKPNLDWTDEEIQEYIAKRALYLADHTPTSVYRLFDAEGHLLYVGITGRGFKRLGQHAQEKEWWAQVASATFQHLPNRAAALEAEALAITNESPRFNRSILDISDAERLREDTGRALWKIAEKEVWRELRDIQLESNPPRRPFKTSVQDHYDRVLRREQARRGAST